MSIKSFANIKKELNGLKLKTNLGDAQKRVEKLIKNAEKDFKKLIESNIPDVMKKFQEEKAQIEIMVDKIIKEEIKKAKSFVVSQKKEFSKLQKKLEGILKTKKATKGKKGAKKKATKKVAAPSKKTLVKKAKRAKK
ncbi:MAG: hypothetical protein L6Q33_01200 [Bacteriovoracaceae bacterium]|nr:hypothetical protein [Bacteriovoracaceae bacterium]